MNSTLPSANILTSDVMSGPLPLVPGLDATRHKIDPDLACRSNSDHAAVLPYIVVLVEPYLPTDPRAADTAATVYRRALVRLASPVLALLERQRAGGHVAAFRGLASLAFFSVCGDRRSVYALAALPNVEFIAYDGLPCTDGDVE